MPSEQPPPSGGEHRLWDEVARVIGSDRVRSIGATEQGESKSTFLVASGTEQFVVKVTQDGPFVLENQQRLVRLVDRLRRRGSPVPEYLGVGEAAGVVFTVQRRLPGRTLDESPGARPSAELFNRLLPELLAAVELQDGAGDLAQAPWPQWLLATIETGGDGYCLHETMRQAVDTTSLLGRLQGLARRNWNAPVRRRDVVHFDLNPANILHDHERLSGIVDWNVPFVGAAQGDRGFDIATLLFYTYDLPATRPLLWQRALASSGLGWTTVYLCHLCLRQVEWVRRHEPGSAAERRFLEIAWAVLDDCEARGA